MTCTRVIGNQHARYLRHIAFGRSPASAFEEMGIKTKRMCCRMHFMCHVDVAELVTGFASETTDGCAVSAANGAGVASA
jgi:DNA-directed RNA polymerase subunit N (RpoN/RPB10)